MTQRMVSGRWPITVPVKVDSSQGGASPCLAAAGPAPLGCRSIITRSGAAWAVLTGGDVFLWGPSLLFWRLTSACVPTGEMTTNDPSTFLSACGRKG